MNANVIDPKRPATVRQLAGLLEMFKIGIGPSSSHTIGPMVAARRFAIDLAFLESAVSRLKVTLFGSLAWTGKGHSTDKAIILGLSNQTPENVTPEYASSLIQRIEQQQSLILPSGKRIPFEQERDLIYDRTSQAHSHPNSMSFEAFGDGGESLLKEVWYSIGGGLVIREGEDAASYSTKTEGPFKIQTAAQLLEVCIQEDLIIAELAARNEDAHRPRQDTLASIDKIANTMLACIDRGLTAYGHLPGGLGVVRRAARLHEGLEVARCANTRRPDDAMQYVASYAIAVNEENASGHRIVTAPTNGAAGVIPAVLRYYRDFCDGASQSGIHNFFLTATLIGSLIKQNASISGAEVGCQGEVGSASAMAAAGLAAALGGSNVQVENAAEIALEHHLGMTCDPIGGLVQIPCIERNAFGAVKAITASSLALGGDGKHRVSLDQVIETMRQTGADMKSEYRETSRGGLAVNVPEC